MDKSVIHQQMIGERFRLASGESAARNNYLMTKMKKPYRNTQNNNNNTSYNQ